MTEKHRELLAEIQPQAEASKKDNKNSRNFTEYENSGKKDEESKQKLKNIVSNHRSELEGQQEKFNEAGNPEYDSMMKLEENMKNKIDQIGKTLKEFLLKQVCDNN